MSEPTLDEVRSVLASARTIAVLGAHPDPTRPAHYVPAYLQAQGYRIVPVNAAHAGVLQHGVPTLASLAEVDVPIDVVDVFRRSEAVPDHLDELLALRPLPRVVWLQSGIRHDATAARLRAAGITVVQDRCTYADHRRLGVGPVPRG